MAMKTKPEIFFFLVLFLDCWQALNTSSSSNSKNLEQDLGKIIDKILLQVLTQDPLDETKRTATKLITERGMKESSTQEKVLKSAEFTSSSSKQQEKLARLFDEILQQVHSRVPYDAHTDESRRTSHTVTAKTDTRKKNYVTIDQNDNLPHAKDILQTNRRSLGNISEEKQDTDPSLFGRDVSELLTTVAQEPHGKARKREVPNQNMSCTELLHFFQKNIILAAASITGILSVTVLLLILLIAFIRRKKPLLPSANVTYNIFIMNGKTWCQNYQENAKKYVKKTDTEGI